jgi:2'-5' RNA ligase
VTTPTPELTALTDVDNAVLAVVPASDVPEDTVEESAVEASVEMADEHKTLGMIAFVPSAGNAERLAVEDGPGALSADELHCTVLFLGEADGIPDETFGAMMDSVVDIVREESGPFVAEGFNVSLFNPHRDDRDTCVVLGLSGRYLSHLADRIRARILEILAEHSVEIPEQHSPWIPHVTLRYTDDSHHSVGEYSDRAGDITFDRIRIALGDDVYDVSLVPEDASEGEIELPEELEDPGMGFAAETKNTETPDTNHDDPVEFATTEVTAGEASAEQTTGGPSDVDGEIPTEAAAPETTSGAWRGILVVEDVESGDGRMFSGGSLKTAPLPLPLMWQRQTEEGHKTAVQAGRIDEVWREGNQIWGQGVFDLKGVDGQEAHRQVAEKFLRGVSVDVDSVKNADIEMVFPDNVDASDAVESMFASPELTVYHHGRLRGATLVQFPAFVEASIALAEGPDVLTADATEDVVVTVEMTAFPSHDTGTSDEPWDADANVGRLPSPMSLDTAHNVFAWYDSDAVEDGMITKSALKFPHHNVGKDGTPGAANLTACSAVIASLHGSRGQTPDIPDDELQAVYDHVAAHIRDADMEPPAFSVVEPECDHSTPETMTACGCLNGAPPREHFENPRFSGPTGLTVTPDGRVYGHAALWGTCHTGFSGVCRTAPREGVHEYFLLGETLCADGSAVATGTITLGTGHAATDGSIQAYDVIRHYDNTGSAVADIATGEDEFGIWFSGSIRENVSPVKLRSLRGSKLSGDWRKFGRSLRLVALLAVNVPGFPVPRVRASVSNGRQTSLVAAGINPMNETLMREMQTQESLRSVVGSLARRIGRDPKTRMAELSSNVHGRK